MSKQALKRVRRSLKLEVNREPLPAFSGPGGYPMLYVLSDGGCICPDCVNANIDEIDWANRGERRFNSHGGWAVDGFDINYEDADLVCDHCGKAIPAAYVD